jgi:hypothetical protein
MYNFKNNPFTPTFGSIPLHLAGRERLISDVLNGLKNDPGDPNRATIHIGARGSGKTVLLTKIALRDGSRGKLISAMTVSFTFYVFSPFMKSSKKRRFSFIIVGVSSS